MLGALAPAAAGAESWAKDARVSPLPTDAALRTVRLSRVASAAVGVWALCLIGGAAYLMTRPSSGGNVVSPRRAVFAAVNAATLTGFEMSWAEIGDWSPGGRGVTALLLLAGTATCWLVAMTALTRLAVGRATTDRIVPLLLAGVLAGPLVALAGAAFGSGFDALSALANGGLTRRPAVAGEPRLWLMLVPLGLLGVLGPTLLVDRLVLRRPGGTPHTRLAFAATAAGFWLVRRCWSASSFSPRRRGRATCRPQPRWRRTRGRRR